MMIGAVSYDCTYMESGEMKEGNKKIVRGWGGRETAVYDRIYNAARLEAVAIARE